MTARLGSTLIIANPASQLGAGAAAAHEAERVLAGLGACSSVELRLTQHPGHAAELAADAAVFDTLVALGGDGTVHECVNGLMRLPRASRPALGVVPVGSGNDYARTLRMPADVEAACDLIAAARTVRADLGCCNGRYFAQTLSFGLDAAIALDTVERRRRTGRTGLALYAASCADQLLHHLERHAYRMSCDGGEPRAGEMYLLAVQVGPSYGSGFIIAPSAKIDDGLLDVCIAHPPLGIPKAVWVFVRAKGGRHEHFKQIETGRCSSLELSFPHPLPVQLDGERMEGCEFSVHVAAGALDVIVA